jgi:hypothetical protein
MKNATMNVGWNPTTNSLLLLVHRKAPNNDVSKLAEQTFNIFNHTACVRLRVVSNRRRLFTFTCQVYLCSSDIDNLPKTGLGDCFLQKHFLPGT